MIRSWMAKLSLHTGFGHLVELAATAAYGEQYAKWDLAQLPLFPATYQFVVSDDVRST